MKEAVSETSIKFHQQLKQLRQQRGWSQGQLAKKIGSDLQRISKYERGIVSPSTEMAVKIASVFQVSLDYLILDEGANIKKVEDSKLLKRVEEITLLPQEDQNILLNLIDAYVKRKKFEELVSREL